MPYALGQAARLRQGMAAIAGNHVTIRLADSRTFVALAHLRSGSIRVSVGQDVAEGQQIGNCGNSGNSTQPHVHVQVMDSADPSVARGVPMTFRRFREWLPDAERGLIRERGVPGEGAVVKPLTMPTTGTGP